MKPLLPLALIALLAAIPAPVKACAVIGRGDDRIDIASEAALIVWDEANKTEYFIRRATFQSTGYDFGFLVPTPSLPEVAESDDDVFTRLADITKPKVEVRTKTASFGCGSGMSPKAASEDFSHVGAGIQILQHKRVGDHDVVSIKFDRTKGGAEAGAGELAQWLVRFGYGFGDALKDWIKPYVEQDWIITAFRILGEKPSEPEPAKGATGRSRLKSGTNTLRAKPVRLTFKTDRPLYPYREPADQRDEKAKHDSRLLRVYFASETRVGAKIGDGTAAWPGQTVWADKLQVAERADVIAKGKLPADVGPKEWFVTEFEDRSSPRRGMDELYFAPSADQSTVARPPIIEWRVSELPWIIGLAICLGLPALTFVVLAVMRMRK